MNDPEYQHIEFTFLDVPYLYIGGESHVTALDPSRERIFITQSINNHLQSIQRHHIPAREVISRTLDFMGVPAKVQQISSLEIYADQLGLTEDSIS